MNTIKQFIMPPLISYILNIDNMPKMMLNGNDIDLSQHLDKINALKPNEALYIDKNNALKPEESIKSTDKCLQISRVPDYENQAILCDESELNIKDNDNLRIEYMDSSVLTPKDLVAAQTMIIAPCNLDEAIITDDCLETGMYDTFIDDYEYRMDIGTGVLPVEKSKFDNWCATGIKKQAQYDDENQPLLADKYYEIDMLYPPVISVNGDVVRLSVKCGCIMNALQCPTSWAEHGIDTQTNIKNPITTGVSFEFIKTNDNRYFMRNTSGKKAVSLGAKLHEYDSLQSLENESRPQKIAHNSGNTASVQNIRVNQ